MSDEPAKKAEPVGSKPSTPKLVLLLLALNLGASGFTTFKVVTASTAEAGAAHEVAHPTTTEIVGPVVALDTFVVNLDEPGSSRYLKLTLQMELFSADAAPVFERSKQLMRDSILSHLSGLHLTDTLGAAAKDKIRTELMSKVEKITGPDKVRRMFFQEFVVQ